MKTGNWCVSANWGIYNHIVKSDCMTRAEATRVAYAYKDRYARMRRQRGRRHPQVCVWKFHESI